jgi:exoribonuclease R/very-short-patch-repair endonuclease
MTNAFIKESSLDLNKIKTGYSFDAFISVNYRGDGYVRSENLKDLDIKIEMENLNKAWNGDFCHFQILGQETYKNKKYYLAKVVKIIERKQNLFGGHIEKSDGQYFFIPHDKRIYLDFIVKDFNSNKLEINDKVLVSVVDYNFNSSKIPYCKIEKIMGKRGDSAAEIATYSEEKGFEVGFNNAIIKESEEIHKAGITEKDLEGRRDFSNVNTFTIDPYDAKDFDDAISVKFLKQGLNPNPSPKEKGVAQHYMTANIKNYEQLKIKALEMRKNPTKAEDFLWDNLKNNNLDFRFRRQHIIDNFIIDFICLEKKIVIEVDGDIHDLQKEKDKERTKILESLGFKVIRFSNEKVLNNIKKVIDKISLELEKSVVQEVLPFGEDLGGAYVEIGVHIADVTHYLREGSAMDNEAQKRTTSVYLVDRVVPMLPEILSNDLCSLVEGKPRLTMSAVFTLDKDGNILEKWFGETIINSWRRFTYEEAQYILQKNNAAENINEEVNKINLPKEIEEKFKNELIELNRISKIYQKKRKERGAISMETEEIKFKLDEKGVPIEVYRKTRFDAHKLVEDFMLLANEEVAKYIHGLGEKTHVGVYRIHDKPDAEKMLSLSTFLYNLGYNAPYKDDTISPKALNDVMDELTNDPNKTTIQTQIVRSMQKAIYSTKNIGHFGLALEFYSHFTSPIRRYPDDMTHRLLKKYLKGGSSDAKDESWHERMCLRSSEREKDAADAERQSVKYKQVEYMGARIGQEFTGIVSGLTNFGIYIEEENSRCEGLIKYKDLGDGSEFFEFDKMQYLAKGDRGSFVRLGDVYKIKVLSTDLENRIIEYKLLEKVREITKKKI